MSTLAYASVTTTRDRTESGKDSGISTYVDAMAALVPAEVLALHALVVSATAETSIDPTTEAVNVQIMAPETLLGAFWGLFALAVVLFVVPRLVRKTWKTLDLVRMFIPPLAYVVWTMLQEATAFEPIARSLELGSAPRTVIALFGASVLGLIASLLAMTAEKSDPHRESPQRGSTSPEVSKMDGAA